MRPVLLLLLWTVLANVLAGCGTTAVQVPRETKVLVPVACVEAATLPKRPATRTEADLLAMDTYRRTLAAWSDLKKLEAYSAELAAIAEGCSRIPKPP